MGIHMQIDALMADLHLACNLLEAPLNAQVEIHIGPDLGIYTEGMTAALGAPIHRCECNRGTLLKRQVAGQDQY